MTRNALIQAVVLKMDEITPAEGLNLTVDGADGNPLYALVDGLIDDGVLELFTVAPYWRLPQSAFEYDQVAEDTDIHVDTIRGRKVIHLRIPPRFLRIAEIECPEFQRPITEIFGEQDSVGKRQHNRYLVGKEAKPVGVMSHGVWIASPGEEGVLVRQIDCYSLPVTSTETGATVSASYIATPASIASTGTNAVEAVVPPILIPALTWLVASRAFGARGDANHAAICQQYANNLLV